MKRLTIRLLGIYLETLSFVWPARAARNGFALFCRPFRVAPNAKQIAFFGTAEKFQVDHRGYKVQGYKWGKGEKKILFLHGWQSHTYRWKPYIEALSGNRYTVYALDAPGHGLSSGNFLSVPLYSSLIEDFLLRQGDVHAAVAHSLGGFSLLYTLYRKPSLNLNRAILLAPPGEATDFISVFQKTLRLSNRTVQLVMSHFAERYQVTPEFFSAQKFASTVRIKGLIIHDEEDPETPYEYSIPLSKVWRESRLISTKGLGHNLKSPTIVREVVDFIQEPVHQPSV